MYGGVLRDCEVEKRIVSRSTECERGEALLLLPMERSHQTTLSIKTDCDIFLPHTHLHEYVLIL